MKHLQHSWFDPTSLMSRDVLWDVLSNDSSKNNDLFEEYRSAFLSEYDIFNTVLPKRRGRQRKSDNIQMRKYPEQLARSIGVMGNTNRIHAMYTVKMSDKPVALVGLSVEKHLNITTSLDLVYVIDKWRRRGLGQAISEHAGRWATIGMNAWNMTSTPLPTQCSVTTCNPLEASLASAFLQSAKETANLYAIEVPILKWLIQDAKENE